MKNQFKVVVAGDTGDDNGIFAIGIYENIETAKEAAETCLFREFKAMPYFAEIVSVGTGEVLASLVNQNNDWEWK